MQYIMLNTQIFMVDDSYQDALDEDLIDLIPVLTNDVVGQVQAGILKAVAIAIPECHLDLYSNAMNEAIITMKKKVNVHTVLRLLVNNETFIHYLISPISLEILRGREGGLYFAYVNDENDEPVLYGANTAVELELFINSGITLKHNPNVITLHDTYFELAIGKLKEMHDLQDVCALPYQHSEVKDPASIPPVIGEDEDSHEPHCEWCIENGLNGLHHWNNDGIVYDNDNYHTQHSHYRRAGESLNE